MTQPTEKKEYKTYCFSCGKEITEGSIWTNGDGYGDGKYVGIIPPDYQSYCWDCYRNKKAPDLTKVIDEAFAKAGMCGFTEAWIGRCRNQKPCTKHNSERCWKCGKPAIRNCSHSISLVCGMPECADHPHMSEHRKEDEAFGKELNFLFGGESK